MIGMLNKLFCLQWKGHAQQTCTLWSLTSRIWKIPVTEQCVMSLSFCLWYFNNERWFSLSASHQAVLFIELPVGSHIYTYAFIQTGQNRHPSTGHCIHILSPLRRNGTTASWVFSSAINFQTRDKER